MSNLPSSSPQRRKLAGIVNGADDALEKAFFRCFEECFLNGEERGIAMAQSYCDQSISTNGSAAFEPWRRGNLTFCGLSYQIGCDLIGFPASKQGLCDQHTKGPLRSSWENFRDKACDYRRRWQDLRQCERRANVIWKNASAELRVGKKRVA